VSILTRFVNTCLEDVIYPKQPKFWHVQGRLKNKSNQIFKFDVRGMARIPDNKLGKSGSTGSNADKMVFETTKNWVIFDIEEINKYVKKHNTKVLLFEDLLDKLDWNIIIAK